MIIREKKKDDYDTDIMDRARTVVYVLVIAAAIMWLGPSMLNIGDGSIKDCGDLSEVEPFELCTTPDGAVYRANADATDAAPVDIDGEKSLVGIITGAASDAKAALAAIMDAAKYVLLVAAIGSIAVMRVMRTGIKPARSLL